METLNRRIMTPTTPTKSPVDTIREAARHLLNAIRYAGPPKEFNEVLCHEARIPIAFVVDFERALSALSSLSTQPAQTEGLEDLAREWVRKTYGLTLAANSSISFDTSEFVKLVAAFARSLSLPRQKGEVVSDRPCEHLHVISQGVHRESYCGDCGETL